VRSAAAAGVAAQISPKARRLAKELGVEIAGIQGTGPDGTITSEDVQAAATAKGGGRTGDGRCCNSGGGTTQPVGAVDGRTHDAELDERAAFFSGAERGLRRIDRSAEAIERGERGGNCSYITDLLIKLIARVLEKHPRMNASWGETEFGLNADINISVAMAVKDGVVGAVIPRANKEPIAALSVLRREVDGTRASGALRPADISGGTFTLSNLGMYKVDAFTAIITPPQCAILAVGAIADAVVPVDGKPGIRPMMTMTLSSDHRVVDGARAAEFLGELTGAIREPGEVVVRQFPQVSLPERCRLPSTTCSRPRL